MSRVGFLRRGEITDWFARRRPFTLTDTRIQDMNYLKYPVSVVVGDGAVGKTCLVTAFRENRFPDDYVPTCHYQFTETVICDGRSLTLGVWDTNGQVQNCFTFHLFIPLN